MIITFLVEEPYKLAFATTTGRGDNDDSYNQRSSHHSASLQTSQDWSIYMFSMFWIGLICWFMRAIAAFIQQQIHYSNKKWNRNEIAIVFWSSPYSDEPFFKLMQRCFVSIETDAKRGYILEGYDPCELHRTYLYHDANSSDSLL